MKKDCLVKNAGFFVSPLEQREAEHGLTPLPQLETLPGAPLRTPELKGALGITWYEAQPIPTQHLSQCGQSSPGSQEN